MQHLLPFYFLVVVHFTLPNSYKDTTFRSHTAHTMQARGQIFFALNVKWSRYASYRRIWVRGGIAPTLS
jgi:hypothetical protein